MNGTPYPLHATQPNKMNKTTVSVELIHALKCMHQFWQIVKVLGPPQYNPEAGFSDDLTKLKWHFGQVRPTKFKSF